MFSLRFLGVPIGVLAASVPWLSAAQPIRDVSKVYEQLCANCHGASLEGGLGTSLIDNTWKYGGDDDALARGIREGYPDNGMPGFGEALNAAEIRALVVFIREAETKAAMTRRPPVKPEPATVVRSEEHNYRIEVLTDQLEIPWSIAFLPDGRMLVTERAGRLRVFVDGKLQAEPVQGTPAVRAQGQGGLLAVAPHPDYARNGWIYLSFSDQGPENSSLTKVVRGRLRNGAFVDQETVYQAAPELYKTGGVHFGSRFVFDGDYLFFSIGERGAKDDAQDLGRPNGKVHRLHHDGRVPRDNPFVNRPGALPSIWSYGHRNPQGLARHPVTGDLWDAEHGPRGGDELNHVQRGLNYGWPLVTYGMNYNGTPITDRTSGEGLEQPVLHWTPSIAVCAIAFYDGDKFPRWKNHLFVTALRQEELRRVVIENRRVTHQEVLFKNIGRVRDVAMGPDGFIYVALEGPGRIARLLPAD